MFTKKVISDNNSFKKIGDKYSIDYNQKRYIISDRDTTIQLGETVDQNGAISKTTKEFLVYNQHQKELVYKKEDILKNSKEISQIINISRSHFFLVGISSYFAAIIFLLITIFTFIVRKGEKGK
jgi:membrane protein insertase Oxa1/YidC/SpoIIIJ